MVQVTPSSTITKIRQEASLFDSKDRFLNFSTKADFQTPLILEAGDLFYEKWVQSGDALPLDTFLPISANFTEEQKQETENQMLMALRQKDEDFARTDLYLVLGFLKWDGNALAPTLLVPLDFDYKAKKVKLSSHPPIENVILRERLKDEISLPRVEDASINGQFSILLYFSLFEKAVIKEKNWKFTRHGLCLAFANGSRLRLKKNFENDCWKDKSVNDSPIFQAIFGEEGFKTQDSYFDEAPFDKLFNPIEHHFLYQLDSHTAKAMLESTDPNTFAFAIQALPGTAKAKVAANIAADNVANGKKVLVVSRRSVTKQNFDNAWMPQFRSFQGPERNAIEEEFAKNRESFIDYYKAINENFEPAQAHISELLKEIVLAPATKTKFSESIFDSVSKLTYPTYLEVKALLEKIVDLYFNKQGIAARTAFQGIKVPHLTPEETDEIAALLEKAVDKVIELQPIITQFENASLFPSGIFISGLSDTIDLVLKNFDENTPVYENWELRSNNWIAYHDSLKALPEAGDNWVRYRRQTSDIYTDSAVDENIQTARDEFVESLNATLKGLSDRYRSSRKALLKVLRNPKSVSSDSQLLDLIDTLLELQENKRAYKDTSVLGNHLLGIDWQYEKSNWFDLNIKIKYLYNFRDTHEKDPKLDFLLQILEHWHEIKPQYPKFKEYADSVKELQEAIRQITKKLDLETPLESLSIEKWMNTIKSWNNNWTNLNIHLQLTTCFKELSKYNICALHAYLQNPNNVSEEIAHGFMHYWSVSQIRQISIKYPDLFTLSPKARYQKSKNYRMLYDQFCNANFRQVHALVKEKPELLTHLSLEDAFEFSGKESFDIVIMLDADCISIVESLPIILAAKKLILIGNAQAPCIEPLPFDAYNDVLPRHTSYFQENILVETLRRGIPTRELWLSNQYVDMGVVNFANIKIYNQSIKQFPHPSREPFKGEILDIVQDKVISIAEAAIEHAQKHPGQTLGIIAFSQERCYEIESEIHKRIEKGSSAERFFNQENNLTRYYVKTPERACDKYRDKVFVCADPEGITGITGEHKIAISSSLAKQELHVFITEVNIAKHPNAKATLFWNWIEYLQKKIKLEPTAIHSSDSYIRDEIIETISTENISIETQFENGGIPVGPVVIDANNENRFLGLIEDDCTRERFRESIEDTEYFRPITLRQNGWKVMNVWLPFWYMSRKDEVDHLLATIAIEQSVAPPPQKTSSKEDKAEDVKAVSEAILQIDPYKCTHPKIEGTAHDKPIAELPAASIITQMKFYVEHEAPIHEEMLLHRILELHHVDRAGPIIQKALTEAITQGLQQKKFVKTGSFFYSLKSTEIKLRERSQRPDFERKLIFVAPEERALLPSSMDEYAIKQALGLLE